jgi:predicted DNA-binding transcriptional regulator AlpA
MDKLVYTPAELATALGYGSEHAIYQHVHKRNYDAIPPPIRLGRRLVWSVETVREWLAAKSSPKNSQIEQKRKRGRPRKIA